MSIGFGVSVWNRGNQQNHLDGIGVYTRELYRALQPIMTSEQSALMPFVMGADEVAEVDGQRALVLIKRFGRHVLQAVTLGQRLNCSHIKPEMNFFHATDHYIPFLRKTFVLATVMDIIPLIHPEWVTARHRKIKNWLFKKMILSAGHVITISEYSKQDLIKHLGIPPERISVTPLGVNPFYFEPVSAEYQTSVLAEHGLNPGFFLFIGTLQPRKNLEALLDAHACLPEAVQKAHPVVIVGQAGWKVEALLSRVEALSLEGKVKWLQYLPQDDVLVLLKNAQALVFISLYEGFGLPVLEAFAAGVPVIASETTSIPEVAGDAAYLLDPQDKQAIAEAMMHMIEDEDLRQACIEKGQARARLFSWARCAAETFQVYRKIMIEGFQE